MGYIVRPSVSIITMLANLCLFSFIFYHVESSNLGGIKYVPPPDCRPCGRSLRSDTDSEYEKFSRNNSARFLFSLPCCESNQKMLQNQANCGVADPDINNRVVGGQAASENQLPWQCGIMHPDNTFTGCAATLINCDPAILVTAAHCFGSEANTPALQYDPSAPLQVSCGAHRMAESSSPPLLPAPLDTNEQKRFIAKESHI